MGIAGLLPALSSITETKSLSDYSGLTLAIDGYCWLHRAIYGCSEELCLGQDTDKYIHYFMSNVDELLRYGITPYVVFDGGPLPMKKGTELERRKNQDFIAARKYFTRAAGVTPFMAHRVIQHLKVRQILYVVAPYEADAQLAYLAQNGFVDGVISEDSDCLVFRCGIVLYKWGKHGDGTVEEIQLANIKHNIGGHGMDFRTFTDDMFLGMCILSGCDYLQSLPRCGIKSAYKWVKQHGSVRNILSALRRGGKIAIPLNYEVEFENAKLTFRHQRVYDPKVQKIVSLTPLPESVELSTSDGTALDFLGPILSDDIGRAIAEGDMDPITLERFGPNMATPALAHDLDAQGDEVDLPESPSAVDADFVASWTNRRRQVLPIAFGTVNVLAVILSHLVINSCL